MQEMFCGKCLKTENHLTLDEVKKKYDLISRAEFIREVCKISNRLGLKEE